ncbi:ATP-binding protein, partial [Streptomyces sp. SB3404]|nr:ATP-binding protein [Streptomyces boncukensis]
MIENREPWEYTLHVPNDPRAVPISRHTLRLVLRAHGLDRLLPLAELLGTELVTNAVTHTKGPAALRLLWDGHTLRIGVWDTDPRPPS